MQTIKSYRARIVQADGHYHLKVGQPGATPVSIAEQGATAPPPWMRAAVRQINRSGLQNKLECEIVASIVALRYMKQRGTL